MSDTAAFQPDAWTGRLPFVRLFATTRRAISFWPWVLGTLAAILLYSAGRVLDVVWVRSGHGVVRMAAGRDEVHAYAADSLFGYRRWRAQAQDAARRVTGRAEKIDAAALEPDLREARAWIGQRLDAVLAALRQKGDLAAEAREREAHELRAAADQLRRALYPRAPLELDPRRATDVNSLLNRLLEADPPLKMDEKTRWRDRIRGLAERVRTLRLARAASPRGVFASLLDYEAECFAACVRAALSGRWLYGDGAFDKQPTLLGSLHSAVRGFCWLLTQRTWYAVIFGLVALLLFSIFGSAICRYAAIQSARDENAQLSTLREFVSARWSEAFVAPLYPLGIFAVVFVLVVLGGLVGVIPAVGPLLVGLFYFLALLAGVALAFCLLAAALGYPLMLPTLAVEHSDAFDAVQRSAGYVFQRPWYFAFYGFVLLLYGAGCFLVLRAIVLLVFKLSHVATATGMSLFGLLSAAGASTLDPLSAIWRMPAWADLPLIPRPGAEPLWGHFASVPLSGASSLAAVLIAIWVFLGVSLLAGYVISFFFCGSTEMYFLLRRAVDGTDYEEIYYEEPAEATEFEAEPAPQPPAEASAQPSADAAGPSDAGGSD